MCLYSYHQFAQCGHRVIDVAAYCDKTKWQAGLAGKLAPCNETLFKYCLASAIDPDAPLPAELTRELVSKCVWIGAEGMCKKCTRQQKLPDSVIVRTNRDALLSQLSSHVVATQIASHRNELRYKVLATHEHPLVHMPVVLSSVYELLGIAYQYPIQDQSTCKILTFPELNFLYTQEAWCSTALVNGVEMTGFPNEYLYVNCGLTPLDRAFIENQFVRSATLEGLFGSTFGQRGIPMEKFLLAAREGEITKPPSHMAHHNPAALMGAGQMKLPASTVMVAAGTTPKATIARPRKSSVTSPLNAPIASPKPRGAGVRKAASTPRKASATPRKVSAIEHALNKPSGVAPPKINTAIDPKLLKPSVKAGKGQHLMSVQDSVEAYAKLNMPPAKNLAQGDLSDRVDRYKQFIKTGDYSVLSPSAGGSAVETGANKAAKANAAVNNVALQSVSIAGPQSKKVASASAVITSRAGYAVAQGNPYNNVPQADASLGYTPIKDSPNSNASSQGSPIDGSDIPKPAQLQSPEPYALNNALGKADLGNPAGFNAAAFFDWEQPDAQGFEDPFGPLMNNWDENGVPIPIEQPFAVDDLANFDFGFGIDNAAGNIIGEGNPFVENDMSAPVDFNPVFDAQEEFDLFFN